MDDGLVDHQGDDDDLDDLDNHQRGVIDRREEGRISPPSNDTPSHCHCRHHHHHHLSFRHCPTHLDNFSLLKKGQNQFGQGGNALLVNAILLSILLTTAFYSNTIPQSEKLSPLLPTGSCPKEHKSAKLTKPGSAAVTEEQTAGSQSKSQIQIQNNNIQIQKQNKNKQTHTKIQNRGQRP